jgi:hypothetical protein
MGRIGVRCGVSEQIVNVTEIGKEQIVKDI